mgnify:CR=1 FL=1
MSVFQENVKDIPAVAELVFDMETDKLKAYPVMAVGKVKEFRDQLLPPGSLSLCFQDFCSWHDLLSATFQMVQSVHLNTHTCDNLFECDALGFLSCIRVEDLLALVKYLHFPKCIQRATL